MAPFTDIQGRDSLGKALGYAERVPCLQYECSRCLCWPCLVARLYYSMWPQRRSLYVSGGVSSEVEEIVFALEASHESIVGCRLITALVASIFVVEVGDIVS
ncbi:unnamed protein product [Prunus armeniaca]|uniref:Uncharacterized protein n=1 Tax=Prunus armeniaca TaxID=36596 RepID=A0A6J5U0K9_PRUAR|nr:unnamed protein product [Prunus armeniaca]CAB4299383.1 unnamed protein product [Prunus armeniaca]